MYLKFPTSVIEQLTQRQIDFIFDVELLPQVFNSSPLLFTLKCRFSLLFPFTVSITLLYVSHWPQSRVCHYKVFQLSIQYARWVLRILHHLIQTHPRKLIYEINLINPLRLLSSWHLTHLLCFNSVLRVYDLRPVPLCTLESLTSTGNLCIFCCSNMSKIIFWILKFK